MALATPRRAHHFGSLVEKSSQTGQVVEYKRTSRDPEGTLVEIVRTPNRQIRGVFARQKPLQVVEEIVTPGRIRTCSLRPFIPPYYLRFARGFLCDGLHVTSWLLESQ